MDTFEMIREIIRANRINLEKGQKEILKKFKPKEIEKVENEEVIYENVE